MAIVNCPRCGKLFSNDKSSICDMCIKEDEKQFELVRLYIIDHQDCTMSEASTETGVSVKKITRYIKEGRIEISSGMMGEIVCDSCGRAIRTGRFCDSCSNKISSDAKRAIAKPTPAKADPPDRSGARMHISKRF